MGAKGWIWGWMRAAAALFEEKGLLEGERVQIAGEDEKKQIKGEWRGVRQD